MIVLLGALVLAALLIAFWVWMRVQEREYLRSLARAARQRPWTDEWESPRILRVEGGIYDVEEDEWR
jgi:hypothetical protein